jgi:hypothetical protein
MARGDVSKCVLPAIALFFATVLVAQKVEKEGKAWLAGKAEPAEINVAGTWHAGVWGRVILNQREGSRDITGTGDEWDILGVVSGKKVFLLFSHKGRIAYSAELSPDGPSSLAGNYADGLVTPKSKTRLMHMTK